MEPQPYYIVSAPNTSTLVGAVNRAAREEGYKPQGVPFVFENPDRGDTLPACTLHQVMVPRKRSPFRILCDAYVGARS